MGGEGGAGCWVNWRDCQRKSTTANYLKELGFVILDADQYARDAVKPGTAGWQEIMEVFGPEHFHPNGELNRGKLGQLIFQDAAARKRLNEIVHPKVIAMIEQGIQTAEQQGEALVFVDVPLLYEIGLDKRMDTVIVVSVDPEIQLQRLQQRDSLSREEAQRRVDSQMPLALKVQQAEYVVDNSGSIEETRSQVKKIVDKLLARSAVDMDKMRKNGSQGNSPLELNILNRSERSALIAHDEKKATMLKPAGRFKETLSRLIW